MELETRPIVIHKGLVIRHLNAHPEDMGRIAPEFEGTAEEFVAAMKADPREWIVGGVLSHSPDGDKQEPYDLSNHGRK